MIKPRKSNTTFVRDLMEFSQNGALMQVFVMQGLQSFAEMVVQSPPWNEEKSNESPISQEAWKRCAQELLDKMEEHFKE